MGLDANPADDFEHKLAELKLGNTPRYLAKSTRGTWEFFSQSPVLGSGPYVERMSGGVLRRWGNRTPSDISYIDL